MSETGAQRGPRLGAARPLSPHLQVWRWHITMACSILTRASGMALYIGLLLLVGWLAALALGPRAYAGYVGLFGTILGKIVLAGLTFSIFYHLAAGIRHLVWDAGKGFAPKTADLTGAAAIAFALAATLGLWIAAALAGAL